MEFFNQKATLSHVILDGRIVSPWDEIFLGMVQKNNGYDNPHTHLCRGDTVTPEFLAHIYTSPLEAASASLPAKQNMTGNLHDGVAYTEDNLRLRMSALVERQIFYGTTHLASCIDVTPDIGNDGQLAFEVAMEIKAKYAQKINIELGPMPIFGFKQGTKRWEVFEKAVEKADFVALLPEKDDYSGLADRDGKIGFRQHLKEGIALARSLGKPVQIHLDQANNASECGTETLIEGLKGWIDQPQIKNHFGPTIWIIHMISTSCYDEMRFKRLVDHLVEFNLGVICCPTAAISMRQFRSINSPTHNSVARVLELCKRKVPVLIGTDNICDLYVPQSDGDMLTEIKMLGHAVRCPVPHILAKLASGVMLNEVDRGIIGELLYQDRKVLTSLVPGWTPAID